jgi:hypothetical protein
MQLMNPKRCIRAMSIAAFTACSQIKPLETPLPLAQSAIQHKAPLTDQAVIADVVGRSPVGASALAWANPSTGSAGAVEQIDATDGTGGCRRFTSGHRSTA